jgi:hypothetical protein
MRPIWKRNLAVLKDPKTNDFHRSYLVHHQRVILRKEIWDTGAIVRGAFCGLCTKSRAFPFLSISIGCFTNVLHSNDIFSTRDQSPIDRLASIWMSRAILTVNPVNFRNTICQRQLVRARSRGRTVHIAPDRLSKSQGIRQPESKSHLPRKSLHKGRHGVSGASLMHSNWRVGRASCET